MVTVNLIGGLGNQLFQYAAGRSLSAMRNVPMKIDIAGFDTYDLRTFKLGHFNVVPTFSTVEETMEYAEPPYWAKIVNKVRPYYARTWYKEPHFHFDNNFFKASRHVYLQGYWQSEKYFQPIAPIIQDEFRVMTPPNAENQRWLEKIASVESVALHIRRGDYVTNPEANSVHGTCSIDYYHRAIAALCSRLDNPHFFVFSDDIPWVKDNLRVEHFPVDYMTHNDGTTDYEDFRLMYSCKHQIIANSSFSWWAAWLNDNPDKLVYAPQQWFKSPEKNAKDLIPATWIKI